jgi:DNA invertase Pin-like site-specific DNA recombinase
MKGGVIVKAVCYIRVSTEEQANSGVSLEAQEDKLLAYCKMQGLDVVEIVREEGVSASKPLYTRPQGARIKALIENNQVEHVVALKLDRLFRDAIDALSMTKEWDNKGIALHLVDMGGQAINTKTAMGRFFLGTMAGFAELERNLIAERTATALRHKKQNLKVYGPTPLGYSRENDKLIENTGELACIEQIRELKKQGWSLRRIAEWLSTKGAPTKRGGRWHASTVRYILNNPLYDMKGGRT